MFLFYVYIISHVNGDVKGAHSRDWVTPLRDVYVIVTKLRSHVSEVRSHVTGDRSHVTATQSRDCVIHVDESNIYWL